MSNELVYLLLSFYSGIKLSDLNVVHHQNKPEAVN